MIYSSMQVVFLRGNNTEAHIKFNRKVTVLWANYSEQTV